MCLFTFLKKHFCAHLNKPDAKTSTFPQCALSVQYCSHAPHLYSKSSSLSQLICRKALPLACVYPLKLNVVNPQIGFGQSNSSYKYIKKQPQHRKVKENLAVDPYSSVPFFS